MQPHTEQQRHTSAIGAPIGGSPPGISERVRKIDQDDGDHLLDSATADKHSTIVTGENAMLDAAVDISIETSTQPKSTSQVIRFAPSRGIDRRQKGGNM